jgi:type II secretory pathway pseudopilin PulG
MSENSSRPLSAYLRETVVIVVSILLAFGVDAWWDGRDQAERRDALLAALAADLATSEQLLDAGSALHGDVRDAGVRWLQLARSGDDPATHALVADSLVSSMQWALITRPPDETVRAALENGDLSLLENQELLAALAGWQSAIRYLNDAETAGIDQWYTDFSPYLRRQGIPLADLVWHNQYQPEGYPIEPRRTEVYRLLPDTEWESLVQARWYIYEDARYLENLARTQLELIRDILREELGLAFEGSYRPRSGWFAEVVADGPSGR